MPKKLLLFISEIEDIVNITNCDGYGFRNKSHEEEMINRGIIQRTLIGVKFFDTYQLLFLNRNVVFKIDQKY